MSNGGVGGLRCEKTEIDALEKEKQMGKIVLSQNTSLDGVMQSPGPTDVPFKYRG